MRLIAATAVFALAAAATVAQVRVYQPPEPGTDTGVSRGITLPPSALQPQPAVRQAPQAPRAQPQPQAPQTPAISGNAVMANPLTGEMRPAAAMPRQLEVFIATSDIPAFLPKKLEEFNKLPELRRLNLVPDVYVDEQGAVAMVGLMEKMVPDTVLEKYDEDNVPPSVLASLPQWDINVDTGGELAQSYGTQNQSTIVYRDPTGAVRLYNLNFEVEKLQRQLAREGQAAQPAR